MAARTVGSMPGEIDELQAMVGNGMGLRSNGVNLAHNTLKML